MLTSKYKKDLTRLNKRFENSSLINVFNYLYRASEGLDFLILLDYKKNRWYSKTWFYTMINKKCLLTGRSKGVLSLVNMSRMVVKEHANAGLLHSIRKAVW